MPRSDRSPNAVAVAAARGTRAEAGFTLLELLIVLAILALLAGFVGPQLMGYMGRARTDTARAQINAISTAVELYALDNGGYPLPQHGLIALVTPPAGATRWRGPYLKKAEGLIDPWGRPYLYRVPGRSGAFEISTLGRDNVPGGSGEDQDVAN
jgi:general secretion pathway protein G